MRTLFIFMVLAVAYGCTKESECQRQNSPQLGTIGFNVREAEEPFNGALEIFPCLLNTTTYFGNYSNDALSVINPSYLIVNGAVTSAATTLMLPLGLYTMYYWGVDNSATYMTGAVNRSGLTLGADLTTLVWSLRPNSDGTYRPTLCQAFAMNTVSIGADNVSVNLARAVAGLNVVIKNKDDLTFNDNIVSFTIYVSGISSRINYATGIPDFGPPTVTVKVPLTISADRLQADNLTAMLYPSLDNPEIRVEVELLDGTTKSYTTTLTNKFIAGLQLTVDIVINEILSGLTPSAGFTINAWSEVTEIINAGTFN